MPVESNGLNWHFYIFKVRSMRNPFKMTKMVEPSCPITPSGKLTI